MPHTRGAPQAIHHAETSDLRMRQVLLALAIGVLPVQPLPAGIAGTWVAEREGAVFVRLEMQLTNGKWSGGLATGDLQVDDNGEVKTVSPVPAGLTPLTDLRANDDTVTFVRPEGTELEQFRLRVLGDGRAELTFLPSEELLLELKDAGIAVPKPIPLRKQR